MAEAQDWFTSNAPPPPPAGTWEDRGIGGQVWHPASGVKESNREDNSLLGMPPELAAISGLAIGKAIGNTALTAVGRTLAGAKAAAGQAWPLVKYAAIQEAFEVAGVPRRYSVPATMTIVALTGGKGAKSEPVAEAPSGAHLDRSVPMQPGRMTQQQLGERINMGTGTPPAPAGPKPPIGVTGPPVAPVASGPVVQGPQAAPASPPSAPPPLAASAPIPAAPIQAGPPAAVNTLPDQKSLNETALAIRRQAYQARMASTAAPAEPVATPAPTAGTVKLSAAETKAFMDLMKRGQSGSEAMKNVLLQRELVSQLGTPTPTGAQTRFPKGNRGKS